MIKILSHPEQQMDWDLKHNGSLFKVSGHLEE